MPTLYTNIDSNKRQSWWLLSGFVLFVIGLGYVFSYALNSQAVLYAAVIFSFIYAWFSYYHSDQMVLAISGAQAIDRQGAGRDIYRLVENLCITAGLPVPKIYLIDDPAPNAFATGRDPEHAALAMTSGLVQRLNKRELEGVIAHELSHIGNRDILLATLVTVLIGVVVLLADWFRRWTFWGGGRRRSNDNDNNQLAVIMMIAALVLSILAPLFAYLIQFAISRRREFLADASGAMLTRDPEGLANALAKIAADDEPMRHPNRATAHLYIASPVKADTDQKVGWWARALMTHPPLAERVKALLGSAA